MYSDLTQIPPQGHFAAVNGMKMYYEIYGEGSPLILLHGFFGSSQAWQPFVSDFAKHFQVIIPDLRGHGRTLDPASQFTFAQTALDVFALLEQLEIDRYKAVGLSGGGITLQCMATQQPTRHDAIVLFSCGTHFNETSRTIMLKLMDLADSDLITWGQRHAQGINQVRSLLNQIPKLMDHYNTYPPDLSAIRAKTLIVFGDRDEMMSVSMPVEMYSSIANAYLWIVPNARHDVIAGDPYRRAMFISTVLPFLQDQW